MFYAIFKHELSYWLRKPAFYIYVSIFFFAALLLSSIKAGIFDEVSATIGSTEIANSPARIAAMFSTISTLIFFLFPVIFGLSIHRDYKSEMHSILYSYPFTKANYLLAKFLSSLLVVTTIVMFIGIGLAIGFRLPGTNSQLLTSFDLMSYMHPYLVYILPNALLFGAIVFAVVAFTRNVAAGFITIILLALIQGAANSFLQDPETRILAAFLDAFGTSATDYYTRYWTAIELNERHLPFMGLVIYNRLLWLGIAALIAGFIYIRFDFGQHAASMAFAKKSRPRSPEGAGGSVRKFQIPDVIYDFSFLQNLKVMWKLSSVDLKYIIRSWPFIVLTLFGLIMLWVEYGQSGVVRGTPMLPVTWKMLRYSEAFQFSMIFCTFLYSGLLVQRSRANGFLQLIDSTPAPNWAMLGAKLFAVIRMQVVMLTIVMTAAIAFQVYKGYFDFEPALYLLGLFGTDLWQFVIWTFLAVFIQTLIRNAYLGTFILVVLLLGLGTPLLSMIGVEQDLFVYGRGPGTPYSDMNGFGNGLSAFYAYTFYWVLAGSLLLIAAGLLVDRGLPQDFKERMAVVAVRLKGRTGMTFGIILLAFLGMGFRIYYEDNIANPWVSSKEKEQFQAEWELKYGRYKGAVQPRITSINTHLDIFPETLNFKAGGTYKLVNKSTIPIDSIYLRYSNYYSKFELNRANELVSEDTLFRFNIYRLQHALQPGDSMELMFSVWNKQNTFLSTHSPVLANGTFLNNFKLFPSLGFPGGGLESDRVRKKYGLPAYESKPLPSDTTALGNHTLSVDSDWVEFEATVSTSEDQIAIAPGYLQKEWVEDGRRFFHYKMDSKMLNIYSFNSARYEVMRDTWNDVNLEIFYHPGHEYNLDRMMDGMKAALDYCSKNFSPYQHKQARIIEFPRTFGNFAQAFPNTIPFSEGRGFIADVDDSEEGGVDYAFDVTVHEMAHQWWAHQVIGADVRGAGVLAEGLADYVRLKVLEKQYGKGKMRKYLRYATDKYLRDRGRDRKGENPLITEDSQPYIRYSKASVVLYAISDYIGEDNLNEALSQYVKKTQFQEAPYTTTLELTDYVRAATPDSLQYLITDMFETITLYDNKMVKTSSRELENGKYEVEIEFLSSKYRNDAKGNVHFDELEKLSYQSEEMNESQFSLPLQDYVDIGIFGQDGSVLYLAKHLVSAINNKLTVVVDKEPHEAGVDPYNKLIDAEAGDNRMLVE